MARGCNFNIRELEEFQRRLDDAQRQEFMESLAKDLAARLLQKVIPRTPVGVYPPSSGKVGGTLRRGWTGNKRNFNAFASGIQVKKHGDTYEVTIENNVEYAIYVENGHRTRNGGFVEGKHMLAISEDELRSIAPTVLRRKLLVFIREVLGE